MSEYVPGEEDFIDSWACAHVAPHDMTANEAKDAARAFLARVRRDAAREALDGLSEWLGDLAEKHPARSAHVPLMQGHITRYTTDNYPEETDR